MILRTPEKYFVNTDNINFFFVVRSKGLHAVCGVFGTKPGDMTEGAIIADGFKTVEEAVKWILDLNRE